MIRKLHRQIVNGYVQGTKSKDELTTLIARFRRISKSQLYHKDINHIEYRITGDGLRPEEREAK